MQRLLPHFQAWLIGAWCSVYYIYTCRCTNVHIKIVWVCCIHPPPQLQTLRGMLSGLSLLCCSPSDRLTAVRIEGMKGEVTVMSKAACFHLSQLRTSTSSGQVWLWLRSRVRPYPHFKVGMMPELNNTYAVDCGDGVMTPVLSDKWED